MNKKQKELVRLSVFAIVLGIVGVAGSLLVMREYPFLKYWPLTTFLIIYVFALINAFVALGVVTYVKEAIDEFYVNRFDKKNPVPFNLHKEIKKEYDLLNQNLIDFNNQPDMLAEDKQVKKSKFSVLILQQNSYNTKLGKVSELNESEQKEFNKYNKLTTNFTHINLKPFLSENKPQTQEKAEPKKPLQPEQEMASTVVIEHLSQSLFEPEQKTVQTSKSARTATKTSDKQKDKDL